MKRKSHSGMKLPGIALLLCGIFLQAGLVRGAEPSKVPQWTGVWATNRYGHELRLQQTGKIVYGILEGCRIVGIADNYSWKFYGTWYLGSDDGSMGVRTGPVQLKMAPDNKSFSGWWDSPETVYTGVLTSRLYGKWDVAWDTNYGRVWFQSSSNGNAWGGYTLKSGAQGRLSGKINENILSGTWQEGREWGLFELKMDPSGNTFTGWRNTATNAWNGKRVNQ